MNNVHRRNNTYMKTNGQSKSFESMNRGKKEKLDDFRRGKGNQ